MVFDIHLFKLVNFQINFKSRVKVQSVVEVSAENPQAIRRDDMRSYILPMKGPLRHGCHFL